MAKKNSTEKIDYSSSIERLKNSGFAASDRGGGGVLISKYGCGAVLERAASGQPQFAERPGVLMGNGIARIVDRGFQKYLQAGDRSVPAAAEELKALHDFEEELRAALGLTGLYNQSLGTVSSRYVYDRLEGREGSKAHQPF